MESVHVPAREARAVALDAGQAIRVVDTEGTQVADLFAFCRDDAGEYASAEHTRVHVGRLFPRVGEDFVTNRRRPILRFEEDRSPGLHDMLCAACDPTRYAGLGANGQHASCQENLERAMADLGIEGIAIPQPINLFQNAPLGTDGSLGLDPAATRPGDSVTLRAALDCYVVVSACPQDLAPINGGNPTSLDLELLG